MRSRAFCRHLFRGFRILAIYSVFAGVAAAASVSPVITGISNGADSSSPPLAPGSIASISGSLLAGSTASVDSGNLPLTLAGVSVSVNGTPAPVSFVSPGHVNVQIPYGTAVGQSAVRVTSSGNISNSFPLSIVPVAPGMAASGSFLNVDSSPNTIDSPATAGTAVTAVLTGIGAVIPLIADGAPSPLLAPAAVAIGSVTVNGISSPLSFLGLAAGASAGTAHATFVIPSTLAKGSYPVIVTVNGRASAAANVFVLPMTSTNLAALPGYLGLSGSTSDLWLLATVAAPGATGTVTFKDGLYTLGTVNLANGTAGLNVFLLSVGPHGLMAIYGGDLNNGPSTSPIVNTTVLSSSTVLVSGTNPAPGGTALNLSALVNPGVATGTVTFKDGSTTLGTGLIINGTAVFSTSSLTPGSHTLTAAYGGDGTYAVSVSAAVVQTIDSTVTSTTLTTSRNPATLGQSSVLTATVSPSGATGVVTFKDRLATLGTGTINGGIATFTTSALGVGAHSLSAVYAGDASHSASTSPALLEGVRHLILLDNFNGQANSLWGNEVGGWSAGSGVYNPAPGVTASNAHSLLPYILTDFTVHVETTLNGEGGVWLRATNAPGIGVGVNGILLMINTSLGTMYFEVVQNGAYGPPVGQVSLATGPHTFDIVVAGNLYSVYADGSGAPLTTLNSAAYQSGLTGVYGNVPLGFDNFTLYDATTPTSIAVTSSLNPSVAGRSLTLTGVVTPAGATGSVSFLDGAATLGTAALNGGTATLNTPAFATGAHSLTAVYSGDSSFFTSTSPAMTQTVNQTATLTTLTSLQSQLAFGQSVALTANVSPVTATGTVSFKEGATTLGTGILNGGAAVFTTSALTVGSHSLTAAYNGDLSSLGSTSSTLVQAVNQVVTATSLASPAGALAYAQNVTFTAAVSPATATGTVIFKDGPTPLGSATLSSGTATFSTSSLSTGSHSITALYGGDTTSAASTSSVLTQVVNVATTSASISSSANPSTVGQSLTLRASIVPPSSTGTVTFRDGTVALGSGSLSGGSASISVSLLPGVHSITGSYSGDQNYAPGNSGTLNQSVVYSPPSITSPFLPAGQTGQPYGPVSMSATGGSGAYSWAASGLPAGLGFSSIGVLNGTPSAGFNGQITVTVTDGISSQSTSGMYALAVTTTPLAITGPAGLGSVLAGTPVSGLFTATGGTAPYTWSLSGVPGLSVDSTGNVSGKPGSPGASSATLTLTDAQSGSVSRVLGLSVFGITSLGIPPATTTTDYAASFTAAGGAQPYTFSISGLPAGISASGGKLTGRPTVAGSYPVVARVNDAAGLSFSITYTLLVTGSAGLKIYSSLLGDATAGQQYSDTLHATGGSAPYVWAHSGGVLPAGFSLDSSGTVTGVAVSAGAYVVGVKATDSLGATAVGTVSINVKPAPLTITSGSAFPSGIVGSDYPLQILTASGGVPPYTFALKGSLPMGLTLAGGQIGGTPSVAGDTVFTVTVSDSAAAPAAGLLGASLTVRPASPDLVLSSRNVAFTLAPGTSSTPPPSSISVASSLVSQDLQYSASASVPWITVTGGSGTPGVVLVGINSSALSLSSAGSPYSGTVTITCTTQSCSGKSQPIAVTLIVMEPAPQLRLGNTLLSFAAATGNPQASTGALTLVNSGGGSLQINSVTSDAGWLRVGSAPASIAPGPGSLVSITADPAGLMAGYYRGTVSVASSGGSATAAVTLFISATATITLGPAGMQFSVPQGALPGIASGSFSVSVSGSAAVSFSASVVQGGAPWLSLNLGSGTATASNSGTIGYMIDPAVVTALPAGAYYGTIRVIGSGIVNSPLDFQVVLNITPANTAVIPDMRPAGLVFVSPPAGPASSQLVHLYASSKVALPWQASVSTDDGGSWLSISSGLGAASASAPGSLTVTADPAGLKPGVYRGIASCTFGSAVRAVNVTLIVQPATAQPATSLLKASAHLLGEATGPVCAGAQLVPTQTGLLSNFSAPTSWPTPLAIKLYDTCGATVGNAQIVATFTNGDPPLPLTALSAGTGLYSGTWTPRRASSQITVTAAVTAAGYPAASVKIAGQIAPNAAPVLAPDATGDVFHPQVGAGLGPGNIIQIYGSGLASQTSSPLTLPLPVAMNGTSVLIGGIRAPLFYVSPVQVNAQIPFELTAGNQYQVIVSANGALTTPQVIQLNSGTPAILNFSSGAVVAQHLDGSLISDSSPAAPGEYVVIYSSGLGATDIAVPSGSASPADPLARVADPPVLTLSGNTVGVLFSGLTPGLVGLYQVNFQVPSDAKTGNYELVLTQGGTASNKTLMSVQAPL